MKKGRQQTGIAGTLQKKFIFASMLTVTILLLTLVGAINLLHFLSVTGEQKRMLTTLVGMEGVGGPAGRVETAPEPFGDLRDGSRSGGRPRDLPGPEERRTGGPWGLFGGPFSMDDTLSRRFFVVRLDAERQILSVDVSRIYAVTEDSAREMAQQILASGRQSGSYGSFRFLLRDNPVAAGETADSSASPDAGETADSGANPAAGETDGTGETPGEGAGTALTAPLSPGDADLAGASPSGEPGFAGVLVVMDISRDMEEIVSVLGISVLIALVCWLAMLVPVHALTRRAIAPVARSIERQKQFVTNAGHELKTPLAIIQTNTEALELYRGESKWTRNIRAQTVRLSGLMQNLLTLSRMDENALLLKKAAVPLGALALEVWENFAESARAGGLLADLQGLSCRDGESREGSGAASGVGSGEHTGCETAGAGLQETVQAYADRDTIAQLLSILFDNAVKYTPKGGRIRVEVRNEGGRALLVQSNTVAPEMVLKGQEEGAVPLDPERLFERFYRTDEDRSRKKGGYGIGLSAARAIAEANDGTISARLEEDRLVFTLALPANRS